VVNKNDLEINILLKETVKTYLSSILCKYEFDTQIWYHAITMCHGYYLS